MPTTKLDALIIGAGFAGLYQLLCLRDRQGLNVQVVEAGGGVGGTWFWNRYPGARCDSESHSYCYSFSPELTQEWQWSERYPQQPEIMRYLNHVTDRFDLRRSISFNSSVTEAHYDAAENRWQVTTAAGEHYSVTYLITAVGCLSTANVPSITGLKDFTGDWYHTGEWPHDGVDFTGKRVGIIGTGSTGIQAIPVIAETAAHLTVFQRTANYSVPARNVPLTEEFQQYVRDNAAQIRATMHSTANGHPFVVEDQSVFDVTDAQRTAIFEAAWAKGGLQFRANFRDITTDLAANTTAANFIKAKIRSIVVNPETAEKLADIDHPYAAKRPPIDSDYFETYNRDNVDLVDVRAAPITHITQTGITTANAEYRVDIIVFATGFDAMTGPMLRIDITGRDGLKLRDAWDAGPTNYLGLQIPGFPNLFTVTGPGSPSVLCNMPVAIEQHAEWIADCIAYLRVHGIATAEATQAAAIEWIGQVNEAANATLLPHAKHSWYLGANIPGKPSIFMPYAGGMARYREICADVAARGYVGFTLAGTNASPSPAG